ncbi:MAG: sugar ABC transporter permease [Acidilobaceae archaeon]|nr:sugar ABC transporter permease [Acidilobaceae archaeon]
MLGSLLVLPALLVIVLLYLYPFGLAVWISFSGEDGFTLEHYQRVYEVYWEDVIFTFWTSFLSAVIAAVLGILIATYLRLGADDPIKSFINQLYRIPIFLPMVVVAQMMRGFLAPHGTLNMALFNLGLSQPIEFFDWKGLVIGFVWKQAPFMALIILSGFLMVKDEHIEAARVAGASDLRVLTEILLPMTRNTVAIAFALAYASNVATFTLPYMLIGGAKPTAITVDIAHRVTFFGDWATANALGVVSFLLVSVFAVFYLREMVRRGVYER